MTVAEAIALIAEETATYGPEEPADGW
jgi:hypothetical protein